MQLLFGQQRMKRGHAISRVMFHMRRSRRRYKARPLTDVFYGRITGLVMVPSSICIDPICFVSRAQDPSAPYAMPELQSAALLVGTSMREVILTGIKGTNHRRILHNSRVL